MLYLFGIIIAALAALSVIGNMAEGEQTNVMDSDTDKN